MWRALIPDKDKLAIGICYCVFLLTYIVVIVIGVDLFFGTSLLITHLNRDPLSGAAWLVGFVIFTSLLGILTNACISEELKTTQECTDLRRDSGE